MTKVKLLEMLGADASLQSGSARDMLLADADINHIADTGKLWCLMLPEDDEQEQESEKDDATSVGSTSAH
ncbi:hypothetical protein [Alteromonas halophila]|uniref:Uncharacterized protein n=1 Tax=Alteromonas halophila TaxID=516698 RepID=A0A918JCJ6_9ALTE|nr:hypothetical protein [Alteromonas halophila]GGW74770.1 hypothetical protein GCM10007391_03530 [Alteromonas halophila]